MLKLFFKNRIRVENFDHVVASTVWEKRIGAYIKPLTAKGEIALQGNFSQPM